MHTPTDGYYSRAIPVPAFDRVIATLPLAGLQINGKNASSLDAYKDIKPKLPTMHERILVAIGHHVYTRAELAQEMGIPTASMSARVNELVKLKKLREGLTRHTCKVTGKRVGIVYRV
jgi:hypothetical protein